MLAFKLYKTASNSSKDDAGASNKGRKPEKVAKKGVGGVVWEEAATIWEEALWVDDKIYRQVERRKTMVSTVGGGGGFVGVQPWPHIPQWKDENTLKRITPPENKPWGSPPCEQVG